MDPPQPSSTGRTLESDRRFRLTCAGDLNPHVVEWLWPGRVPLGMLTMFAGDPKLGKSYVTLAMAAAVSRGLPMPGGDLPGCPGSTVLMSAEDDPARTEESDHGPKVVWSDAPVPITAAEALRPQQDETESGVSNAQECARWLAHFLEDGPKPSVAVFKAAVKAGYSREQVKYAKHRVGATAQKHGLHEGARWTWQLRPA